MSRLRCRATRVDVGRRLPLTVRHTQTCLRCQAEAVRGRRLRRELRALREDEATAPETLVPAVEHRLDLLTPDHSPSEAGLGRKMAAAGAVTATAVGAAFVMVWRRSNPVL